MKPSSLVPSTLSCLTMLLSCVMKAVEDSGKKELMYAINKITSNTTVDFAAEELKKYLPSDSKTIKFLYKPLTEGLFGTALKRARLMRYTKQHFPGIFNRAKQIR